MSIIRLKNRDKWVVIDKKPIEDANISWQAKGLLTYLLSKPNDWQVHISQLSKASKNGRDSTRATVQELVDCGYIIRTQVRDTKGHFKEWEYLVCEESISKKAPLKEIEPFTENPTSGNPKTGNPTSENPTSENPTLLNKDLLSKDILSNEDSKREGEMNFPALPEVTKEEFSSLPEPLKELYRKVKTADSLPDEETAHLFSTEKPKEEKKKVPAKKKRFDPPSLGEAREYFQEKGIAGNEPDKFWHYYDSKDWKVGKEKMSKWKSSASGWINRMKDFQPAKPKGQGQTPEEQMQKSYDVLANLKAIREQQPNDDEY